MHAAISCSLTVCGSAVARSSNIRPSACCQIQAQQLQRQHLSSLGSSIGSTCQRVAAAVARQQQWCRQWRSSGLMVVANGAYKAMKAKAAAAGVKVNPSPEIIQLLGKANAVTFDVDSTFCCDESIDEIAAFLGVGEQVAALTAQAMGGSVSFQEALAARLGVMQPSRDDLRRFLEHHPPQISLGIPELVALLKAQGKEVFLVSGGFRAVIHPIADMLGIPLSHVFANTILFNEDGSYAGFDTGEFPSRSGGKAEAVKHIKQTHDYQAVVMVGDGITDFEARAPGGADAFIGYGGVVYREKVAQLSDWYVFTIPTITAVLQEALGLPISSSSLSSGKSMVWKTTAETTGH